jgi:hypothetical protein
MIDEIQPGGLWFPPYLKHSPNGQQDAVGVRRMRDEFDIRAAGGCAQL